MATTLNTSPIYTASGDTQWAVSATTGNTTKDLTSGTIYTVFTASDKGGYVQRIRFKPLGVNIATVARVWINNGLDNTASPDNNTFWDDISLAATAASEVSAQPTFELPLNMALPAGYKLIVTLGTAVFAGYTITVIGGKY